MSRFITTAVSSRSQGDVFDYLADMRNASEWDPGVEVATVTAAGSNGDVSEGTMFDVTLRLAGRQRHVPYRISVYDRPRRLVLEGIDPTFRSIDTVTFETQADGSTVATYEAVLDLLGMWKIAAPMIAVSFARIGRRAGTGLSRVIA